MSVSFSDLLANRHILRALEREGYETPTDVQAQAIPHVLEGRDLLATAQTGTGKTAAFALPILERLEANRPDKPGQIRALILTPTRELALQIDENIKSYSHFIEMPTAVILGGVPQHKQLRMLKRKPKIVVATPGRLLDLFEQGHIALGQVETLVLDEADRMLDMGFYPDVKKIVGKLPESRQTLLFSATLSQAVMRLASGMLVSPARVEVSPPASISTDIEQKVYFVNATDKRKLLVKIFEDDAISRALVFTRTKHRAEFVKTILRNEGISVGVIHGDKQQVMRQKALSAFDQGKTRVLVGTDVVARGIDVDGITHVINFELPSEAEAYVHRIGRTARAGASGTAISFCDAHELTMLLGIERLTKDALVPETDHEFHSPAIASLWKNMSTPSKSRGKRRFGRGRYGGKRVYR